MDVVRDCNYIIDTGGTSAPSRPSQTRVVGCIPHAWTKPLSMLGPAEASTFMVRRAGQPDSVQPSSGKKTSQELVLDFERNAPHLNQAFRDREQKILKILSEQLVTLSQIRAVQVDWYMQDSFAVTCLTLGLRKTYKKQSFLLRRATFFAERSKFDNFFANLACQLSSSWSHVEFGYQMPDSQLQTDPKPREIVFGYAQARNRPLVAYQDREVLSNLEDAEQKFEGRISAALQTPVVDRHILGSGLVREMEPSNISLGR